MSDARSIQTFVTTWPRMSIPRISPARASTSSAFAASLMPPAFPRPPMSTCALTTTGYPMASAAARASAGLVASRPSDTGMPWCRKSSFPWYSCRSKARASLPPRPRRPDAGVCEHLGGVSRSSIIVLLALGATFAGFVLASNAQRIRGSDAEVTPSIAAGPQSAKLDWNESYGKGDEEVVFTVDTLDVTRTGWRARVGIENRTSVGWELAPGATAEGSFGLQLYETGEKEELDERNRRRNLPAVRAAKRYEPELPRILEPKAAWKGDISAPGPLAADSWVRVAFGTLIAVGKPPEGFDEILVWITDNAYRLRA